ncbi:MAG: NAD(P)/FAD-dependent oxidoreductase [Planctomycetota bacterium]|nr:MAG: NAD(P)/FAD-dependent oxidoreductase [Planctomycetota bacterium]
MHHLVIVGGGPIGSYLAGRVAEKGIPTLVLEEHQCIGKPVHCTGIVGSHGFEEYDLNRGAILGELHQISMVSPSGERITYSQSKPLAYAVCRTQYDQYLAQKAMEKGAEYRLGKRVKALEQDEKGVTIFCSDGEKFKARLCVLATGALSNLPYHYGIGQPKRFMLAAQVLARIPSISHTEVYVNQNFAPGFFAWAVPIGDGYCRVGLCSPQNSSSYLKKFLTWLGKTRKIDLEGRKPAFSRIPVGMCQKSYNKRIIALGDAASHVKPTTGGGLYYGMKCGDILAKYISPEILESPVKENTFYFYEQEWKKSLGRELRTGYFFKELISLTDNQKLDKIIKELKKKELYDKIFSFADFDYHSHMIWKIIGNLVLLRFMGGSFLKYSIHRFREIWNNTTYTVDKSLKG